MMMMMMKMIVRRVVIVVNAMMMKSTLSMIAMPLLSSVHDDYHRWTVNIQAEWTKQSVAPTFLTSFLLSSTSSWCFLLVLVPAACWLRNKWSSLLVLLLQWYSHHHCSCAVCLLVMVVMKKPSLMAFQQ
jgi:hypothetical protein